MKKTTLTTLMAIFISLCTFATENEENDLQIQTEGYIVTVLDFEDGSEIKLFEAETGIHILSKTRGFVDLSQLPNGTYILEDTNGKAATIERTEITLSIMPPLGTAYVVKENASNEVQEENTEELLLLKNRKAIDIKQEGNIVTVIDFEENEAIKLFEVKNTVHVLTKTSNIIDLTYLPAGKYFIENKDGAVAFIEKFADENDSNTIETSYLYASRN